MKRCLGCTTTFDYESWACPTCGVVPSFQNDIPLFAPHLSATTSGFDPGYYEHLFRLEDDNFWFRSRNRLILWAIRRFFPHTQRMLEIGCGTGYVLSGIEKEYPEIKLTGSEIHAEGLFWTSKRIVKANFLQMDARQMPFEVEFDLLGAFDVIEHIEEDTEVLREAYRSIKPGGGILITVPQHQFLWSTADEYAFHKRRYSRKDLRAKVEAAGFQVTFCTSFVTFLLPAIWVSRFPKKRVEEFDPEKELRVSTPMNRILEAVMDMERLLISAGLNMPVGGSLLLVGKKA